MVKRINIAIFIFKKLHYARTCLTNSKIIPIYNNFTSVLQCTLIYLHINSATLHHKMRRPHSRDYRVEALITIGTVSWERFIRKDYGCTKFVTKREVTTYFYSLSQETTVYAGITSQPVFIYVIQVAQINMTSLNRLNAASRANKRLYY